MWIASKLNGLWSRDGRGRSCCPAEFDASRLKLLSRVVLGRLTPVEVDGLGGSSPFRASVLAVDELPFDLCSYVGNVGNALS